MPRSLPLSLMHEVIGNPGGNLESASRTGGSGVGDFDLGTGQAWLRNWKEENTVEDGGDDVEEDGQRRAFRPEPRTARTNSPMTRTCRTPPRTCPWPAPSPAGSRGRSSTTRSGSSRRIRGEAPPPPSPVRGTPNRIGPG